MVFVGLFVDWRLRIAFFLAMFGLYLTVIFLPFVVANAVQIALNKARRQFENIAFRRSTGLKIKQKINIISNLSGKAGFTCSNWFPLGSFTGLLVGIIY